MTHQKKPHIHAEIMKAYADDVNLIALAGFKGEHEWTTITNPSFIPKSDYFLCLPKHKDAVLNMLNGGESQIKTEMGWIDELKGGTKRWNPNYWYMCDEWESRAKPKKEKRWIGVFKNGNGFMQNTETSYKSIKELKASVYAPNGFAGWQFIEIEFEV